MIDEAAAIQRAAALAESGRALLGLCGPPGVGKSHLAARVNAAVAGSVVVGMDGFHLAHNQLERLGRVERKGAIDTFDAHGYLLLIQRIRDQRGESPSIWAPAFRREIEDPIAGAVEVRGRTRLVITEGNYLLDPSDPWDRLPSLLDEIWYLDLDDGVRRTRLRSRHESYGRTPEQAAERTDGNDERNAERIRSTRARATVIVRLA